MPDPRQQAMLIYASLHEQARSSWFFDEAGVPNTLDGRFELLVLHVFLWIDRMKKEDNYDLAYEAVTEQLLEVMFDDLDAGLREVGVGDTGVPRRIKAMAEALYGRIEAYEDALSSKQAVHVALQRNVYNGEGDESDINRLQLYLGYISDALTQRPPERLAEGTLQLPSPDDFMEQ